VALLHGTGGTTGRRSRVDRRRAPESESGALLGSLLPGPDGAGISADEARGQVADLRLDRGLSISRDDADGPDGPDGADGPDDADGSGASSLEATLLRLAAAGPTRADVLDLLVQEAAILLEAPARIAVAVGDRLVWTMSSGDGGAPIGTEVDVERTACGEAWRTGLIQNVTRPASSTVISLDQPRPAVGGMAQLTTKCCGSPPVLLAVPLLREGPPVAGRHAGFTREVFAVLALIGERPNWFDDDDIEATADLAEVAGERIAALALIGPAHQALPAGPELGADPDPIPRRVPDQRRASGQAQRADADPVPVEGAVPNVVAVPAEAVLPGSGVVPDEGAMRDDGDVPGAASRPTSTPVPVFVPAPEALGDLEPVAPEPTEAVRARTASFEWPPFLTPSEGSIPAATTSITVVPAVRPGRSGFSGWFTRTPKASPARTLPGQRRGSTGRRPSESGRSEPVLSEPVLTESVPSEPAPSEPAPSEPVSSEPVLTRPASSESRSSQFASGAPALDEASSELTISEPTRSERVLSPPVSIEPTPTVLASNVLVPNALAPDESDRSEPVPSETVPSESVTGEPVPRVIVRAEPAVRAPARRTLVPSFFPNQAGRRPVSDRSANGFGPTSRLIRARSRATTDATTSTASTDTPVTTGTAVPVAMPAAMPAPDSMGLWQWDAISGACTWSSPVARLLGMAPDAELTLDLVREAVAPADRGRFDVAVRAIGTGRGVAGAVRLKTADGRAKHAYAWSEVRRDEVGRVLGAWGGVVDVTAFEHDAAALRSGLAGLRAAQELTGLATWEWRSDTRQLIWSDEMYRLAGVPAETFEPTPERWHAFVHPDDLERARRLDLDADLDAGPGADGERVETFRLIGPGGEIRHVQSWSATSGERVVYGATIDVTRQVHDRITLERLSATDPITGLGNRLAFDRRMEQLLTGGSAGRPPGRPAAPPAVTLILLDLDRFKVVNDSLGHQVGDRLLIEVARRLVAVVPKGSVTARMGGDEFVVVPPAGAGEPDVRRLASSIVEALRAPYVLPETGEMLICPASLGVAMSERRRVSGHDLLREADIALYRAKDAGRDRYVIFDEALKARTRTRQRAERRLRAALEEDRLVMQYQPVVDFSNGRVIGAEGLVRLHDSEDPSTDRLIAPELFLDIAEQTGLVVEIDCWVIEAAIEQLTRWARPGEAGPWLAINLSARSMEHPRVIRRLIEAVKRGEVDRDRIKIELTERSFIGSLPGVDAGVRQLIANGVGVGIDDFGTGYSALAYLQHFDLDFMKIDRSFVSSVGEGPRGDAVVTAIVDLAHAHGMRVIAEGVESGRQARRLREIGCDFAQGFHFGRPGEADRIVRG
jgi:diguanylate cyclase (GGDEF)-like protein